MMSEIRRRKRQKRKNLPPHGHALMVARFLACLTALIAPALALHPRLAPRPHAPCLMCVPAGFEEAWPQLLEIVDEEAADLALAVDDVAFARGKLSVLASGGVDDLVALNRRLSERLDDWEANAAVELPPYMLEVASPGVSDVLRSDADYAAFKGFGVQATLTGEYKKRTVHEGTLLGRDGEHVLLNLKGRVLKLPRELVAEVRLPSAKREKGDPY